MVITHLKQQVMINRYTHIGAVQFLSHDLGYVVIWLVEFSLLGIKFLSNQPTHMLTKGVML